MKVRRPPVSKHASGWVRWAGLVEGHPGALAAVAVAITLVAAVGLTQLRFSTSQDTMISSTSKVYRDNVRYQRGFGGEVMVVIYQGDVRRLFTPANRATLTRLEAALERTGRFHSIVGPDTSLVYAAREEQLAGPLSLGALARDQDAAEASARKQAVTAGLDAAQQDAAAQRARTQLADAFKARTASDATRLAAVGAASLDNPRFVEFLLFDEHGAIRAPELGAFPDPQHALMVLTLDGNMSIDEQGVAAGDVARQVRAMPVDGLTTTVTGSAALLKEVNDRMRSDMATTGVLALAVMAVILLLVFRARWRLLVLPLVVLGIVWAFGTLGFLGIPLTMVTISGLPILIGLGVDFAIQVHSRYEEETAVVDHSPLARALAGLGPALSVAMVAAVVGFLALRISSVPMIRAFGVMLGVGSVVLLAAVLVLVPLVLVLRDRRHGPRPLAPPRRFGLERLIRGLTTSAGAHPIVVGGLAVVIAASGLVAQRHISVESDPERFVPQDSQVLKDLHHLRDVAGTSASLGVMVEADDVMRADVLAWMAQYEQHEIAIHPGQLLRSSSIASITQTLTASTPTPDDVRAVVESAPTSLRRLLVADGDRRAQMLFSVGHLSLSQQDQLLREMRADVHAPPGVTVTPSGLVVVGIETVHALQHGQSTMTLVAIGAVLLWLLVWFRRPRKAALTMLPVLTAVGASSLAITALGIKVSALGALSSALAIAVCTEFSVIVLTRYDEERARGRAPDAAIATATLHIGRAFTASGLTTAGGFAVLTLSGFPLLSSFGMVVAVNVVAAMLCALVIMPPLLRGTDGRGRRRPVVTIPGDDRFGTSGSGGDEAAVALMGAREKQGQRAHDDERREVPVSGRSG